MNTADDQSASAAYLHGHHDVVVAAHERRTAEEAAAFVGGRIGPGDRVLDLGCGPGTITAGLTRWVEGGFVVGLDASRDVLRRSARNAPGAALVAGDALRLPFADAAFDAVFAHQVLQHLPAPASALAEAKRVLRPGGIVALRDADYGTMTHHPREPLLDRWLELYLAVARAVGGNPDAGRRLLSWVTAAGFVDPVTTTSTWTFADAESRAHWASLWRDRIRQSRFADHALAHGLTTRDELEDIAAAWTRWRDRPDGFFAFIHGEVVASRP